MSETETKIRNFLSRFFRKRELQKDEDIFSLGFVNSLFSMQLVMFLEKEFDITMENADLDMAHFKSIQSILCFIEQKTTV